MEQSTAIIENLKTKRKELLLNLETLKISSAFSTEQKRALVKIYNDLLKVYDTTIAKNIKVNNHTIIYPKNKALEHKKQVLQSKILVFNLMLADYQSLLKCDTQTLLPKMYILNAQSSFKFYLNNKTDDQHAYILELMQDRPFLNKFFRIKPTQIIKYNFSDTLQFLLIKYVALKPSVKHIKNTLFRLKNELQQLNNYDN